MVWWGMLRNIKWKEIEQIELDTEYKLNEWKLCEEC
jgi:hypothetical protein